VETVLNFLAEQQERVQYYTLAGYRSAISHFHDKVEGVPVGKHALVKDLMKGAFRSNPPIPKCTQTWDVNTVLVYIQEMGPNTALNQKEVTLKLAMLLALVCRARGHELKAINPKALSWNEEGVVCHILTMTKTKTPSKPHKSFSIKKFDHSNNLDPVRCLEHYLNMTASQRDTPIKQSQLFLSFAEPHHPVKSCSIARWLKLLMQDAGIDITQFKAHSTRSAAVSKVPLAGMSVDDIARLGDWTNATTFFRFYKKEIQGSSESVIQESILSM
jgi:hypothetical protein